ncbi:hypothetical protein QAD02_014249 [Eretmocerus hayati]|uniref:Uncharacterized protein n=1 Tax=Eretmocerus hayati TaxID=131215 RepID=A0ACC2P7L7_9HYME|nr:hypothetical protein QAD02_014249 [Eretmocerus hayati]
MLAMGMEKGREKGKVCDQKSCATSWITRHDDVDALIPLRFQEDTRTDDSLFQISLSTLHRFKNHKFKFGRSVEQLSYAYANTELTDLYGEQFSLYGHIFLLRDGSIITEVNDFPMFIDNVIFLSKGREINQSVAN